MGGSREQAMSTLTFWMDLSLSLGNGYHRPKGATLDYFNMSKILETALLVIVDTAELSLTKV